MALSCRAMISTSASDKSRRARSATLRTSSALNDMATFPSSRSPAASARHRRAAKQLQVRHLERLAFDGSFDEAAADRLDADADGLDGAVDLDLDALEIGDESAFGLAGDLAPDAAKVFRLAAASVAIAAAGFLAGDCTFHGHDDTLAGYEYGN